MNGSSSPPKLLIVMPNAQRAITSIVKALNCLGICKIRDTIPLGMSLSENTKLFLLLSVDFPFTISNVLKPHNQTIGTLFYHYRHLKIHE